MTLRDLKDLDYQPNQVLGRADLSESEMEQYCKMANAHDFIMSLPQVSLIYSME
ncbi:unnamed protein product [Strongylus vulgaris]|uniref:Uncharacterized protein n=1 Tax=Strongylus vulgaris TaxID=40348 RepID=A0A3P7JAY4_STRVU|nr:unnamed protein product [Strongylus vulgaris]